MNFSIYSVYLFATILLILIDVNSRNVQTKKIIFVFVFLALVLFIGFRYEIGLDWVFYSHLYEGQTFSLAIEPGFMLLASVFSTFASYWVFQSFITAFTIISLSSFCKNFTRNYCACILIFFVYQFGLNSEALRQLIALAIVLIAYTKYLFGSKRSSYVMVFIASTFHISAMICILPLLLLNRRSFGVLRTFTSIGLILSILGIYPIQSILTILQSFSGNGYISKILWYGSENNIGSIFTVSLLFKIAVTIFFEIRFKNHLTNLTELELLKIKLLRVSLYLLVLIDIYLGQYGTISTRLNVYMIPSLVIAIVLILEQFKVGISKLLVTLLFLIYFFFNFQNFTSNYYFENFYLPYRNYLEKIFGYEQKNNKEAEVEFYLNNKDVLQ
ncbi:EpsG family protein [Enterobacter sp. CC120223-11]|uniref:EpsG family protein n=1 Tax=Enterobacter sp. CC120223-11 TaxID=1378073 RepID=UPI000BC97A55|nr:EpsG family protein [Enterobacter sp. CC120223-11]SNY64175.1 EpsG family protein [Enterobacter sp. CC120223-11]